MNQPLLFVDLDGTLTDSAPGVTRSLAYALERVGAGDAARRDLAWCVGPPLRASLATMLGGDPALIEAAVAAYRERFAAIGIFENRMYDGVRDALADLTAAGVRLALATAKPLVYARDIVEHFEIARYFRALYGSELDGRLADKGELLAHALAAEGAAAGPEIAMLGDREHDVIGARANGIRAFGAAWGYAGDRELVAARPERIFHAPAELRVVPALLAPA